MWSSACNDRRASARGGHTSQGVTMTSEFSSIKHLERRDFLKAMVGAGSLLALTSAPATLLSACGSSENDTGTAAKNLGPFALQVHWYKDMSWAAMYVADDRGLYRDEGFDSFQILYGGPGISVVDALLAEKANMALDLSEAFATRVSAGAPLVAVAAILQKSPTCFISLPDNPVRKPKDIEGKRVGLVVDPNNPTWISFAKLNNIDTSTVTLKRYQDVQPLVRKEVDAFMGWNFVQPLALRQMNVQHVVMNFADSGFSLYQQLVFVTKQELEQRRDRTLAGLRVVLRAQQLHIENPQPGLDLTLNKYAVDAKLNPEYARQYVLETNGLTDTPVTRLRGLGYMDEKEIERNIETLAAAGLTVPKAAYDTSLLDEIYEDGIDLT